MFRTVFVPLDGSEFAQAALEPLQRLLAEVEDARAVLFCAKDAASDRSEAVIKEQVLQPVADRLAGWGLACDLQVAVGDPAGAILDALDRVRPDLVVMATHGRSGVERVIRGSVAERVLRKATMPLLLVNPRAKPRVEDTAFRRILVPLDGSPLADKILPYVIAVARSVGSEVTLLRVEPIEPYLADPLAGIPMFEPLVWNEELVRESLEPQRKRLIEARVDVSVHAAIGEPAFEINRLAREHDLVALSSHGRSGPSRWWFGSVAEHVLRTVQRPVFVVRGAR